jgi:hypothetical protein
MVLLILGIVGVTKDAASIDIIQFYILAGLGWRQ